MKMTIEDMKNAATQMQQEQYINEAIEELEELSHSEIKLQYFRIPEHDENNKEYLLVKVNPKEMDQIKQIIRTLNFNIHVEFFHPIIPDESMFINSKNEIKYVGVLKGYSEELWPFMIFYPSKWLEEFIAFEYSKKNRLEIFPEEFLPVLDNLIEYSWNQNEYLTPKLKKKVKEITQKIESFQMVGFKQPTLGLTLLHTPYTNARALRKNMNIRNMKIYMYEVFKKFKIHKGIKDINDLKNLLDAFEAIMIGFIACRISRTTIEFAHDKMKWNIHISELINMRKVQPDSKVITYLEKLFITEEQIEAKSKEFKDSNGFESGLPEELLELFKELNIEGDSKIVPVKISSPEDLKNFLGKLADDFGMVADEEPKPHVVKPKRVTKSNDRVIRSRGKREDKGENND